MFADQRNEVLMDKVIILFKGGVETQEFFSIEAAKTFETHGYEVYWFDLVVSGVSAGLLREFYTKNKAKRFAAFTFNFSGIAGEDGLFGEEYKSGNFWDDTEIPVFNMVVDHPLYYHKYLCLRPKKYYQICIDKNHVRYMKRFFPDVSLAPCGGFLPLGGTEINAGRNILKERYLPVEKRNIDVIFTGNYTPLKHFDRFLEPFDREYQEFYRGLVDELILHPDMLVETAAEECLRQQGVEFTDEELKEIMPNLMFVDLSVRFYFRAKVIAALADSGVKVHTFGAGWDLLECAHPENIIRAGSVSSQTCLDMISQSKISVNVMPWFKQGAHDRVFNSMLNGALCVTDGSAYLHECFEQDRDICFYSLLNVSEAAEQIKSLLADYGRLEAITDSAYQKCRESHTWKCRTEDLIEWIEGCAGQGSYEV